MFPPTAEITDFVPGAEEIKLAAKGHSVTSKERGTMGKLKRVMVVEDFRAALISVPKLDNDGLFTITGNKKTFVMDQPPTLNGFALTEALTASRNLYL
jgi:glucokinase